MANIKLYTKCPQCAGTGKRIVYGDGMQNPPTVEIDCVACATTGYIQEIELDSELLTELQTKVDYVYSKTDNIINKLNDIKDKCNDIWDKVK